MSHKRSGRFLVMLALVTLTTCGRGEQDEKAPEAAAEPASPRAVAPPTAAPAPSEPAAAPAPAVPAAPAAAAPQRVIVSVEGVSAGPEAPLGTVDVAFDLPPGWGEETAWGKGRWGPPGGDLAFGLSVGCNGSCAPAAIAANMATDLESREQSAARPNFNTGDPARDAIRAAVERVADETLPNGRILALRVTYSDEVMASGPYRPQLRLACAWHRSGDAWYVTLDFRAGLEEGQPMLPVLLDVCRSVEVLGPTPVPESTSSTTTPVSVPSIRPR